MGGTERSSFQAYSVYCRCLPAGPPIPSRQPTSIYAPAPLQADSGQPVRPAWLPPRPAPSPACHLPYFRAGPDFLTLPDPFPMANKLSPPWHGQLLENFGHGSGKRRFIRTARARKGGQRSCRGMPWGCAALDRVLLSPQLAPNSASPPRPPPPSLVACALTPFVLYHRSFPHSTHVSFPPTERCCFWGSLTQSATWFRPHVAYRLRFARLESLLARLEGVEVW